MKIFAIIVTYNGSRWVEKCLSSLTTSSVPVHIIVIDNASSDNTVAIIKEKFSNVEVIPLDKNLGFGSANNIGFKRALQAKFDYVFLLNQDAYIQPDAIEKLINVSKRHPDFGIVSPFHFNYEGTHPEKYFDEWVMEYYSPGLKDDWNKHQLKEIYETSFVHAACWLMPISTIKNVGGFDPLFFHYGEDNDYAQRVHHNGKKIGILVKACVYHDAQNPALSSSPKDFRQKKNELIFSLKNLNVSTAGVVLLFFKGFVYQLLQKGDFVPVYKEVLKNLRGILSSRIEQKRELAYLKS